LQLITLTADIQTVLEGKKSNLNFLWTIIFKLQNIFCFFQMLGNPKQRTERAKNSAKHAGDYFSFLT
jgi:hypothetical protein